MNRLKTLSLVLIPVILMTACGKNEETASSSQNSAAVNVTVAEAEKRTIENTVTYTGEVKASEYTSVSAKVGGQAKKVYVKIGDYVEKGDILLEIDDTDYRTQYNQANAAYGAASAQYNSITNGTAQQTKIQLETALNSAKIEYNNAKINYENQKILYENGAISKSVYDSAVTRYENAQINLDSAQGNYDVTLGVVLEENKAAAKANLSSASVAVESARNALNNTVVRAPISGYISNRNANIGQFVSPGVEIFAIKSTDAIEAQINVTESVIAHVAEDTKAIVKIKTIEKEIEGKVTTLSTTKNPQTGLYQIGVVIDNSDSTIKDGMFADVTLTLNASEDALVIPSDAILEDDNTGKYVYVADKDTAKKIKVNAGIITDEYTEIISGLKEGDKVIVSGKEYLSEKNNKVRIVK